MVGYHVRKGAMECECRVVEFVAVLSLPEEIDRGVLIFEGLPIGLVEATPGSVAVCAYSVKACPILAVVK